MCNLKQLMVNKDEYKLYKNRRFHVPQPTFLFPLETPLRLSRKYCMDGKTFNACQTPRRMYLSTFNIVSELYDA